MLDLSSLVLSGSVFLMSISRMVSPSLMMV